MIKSVRCCGVRTCGVTRAGSKPPHKSPWRPDNLDAGEPRTAEYEEPESRSSQCGYVLADAARQRHHRHSDNCHGLPAARMSHLGCPTPQRELPVAARWRITQGWLVRRRDIRLRSHSCTEHPQNHDFPPGLQWKAVRQFDNPDARQPRSTLVVPTDGRRGSHAIRHRPRTPRSAANVAWKAPAPRERGDTASRAPSCECAAGFLWKPVLLRHC